MRRQNIGTTATPLEREILASAATFAAAKVTYLTQRRSVSLKDIAEPVDVASIDWR